MIIQPFSIDEPLEIDPTSARETSCMIWDSTPTIVGINTSLLLSRDSTAKGNGEEPLVDGYYVDEKKNNSQSSNLSSSLSLVDELLIRSQTPEEKIKRLNDEGFSTGLAKALLNHCIEYPLRIWIVDNSCSMQMDDGRRSVAINRGQPHFCRRRHSQQHTVPIRKEVKIISCSRWGEIKECVYYHARLAGILEAPTTFRLLNKSPSTTTPQQFGIAEMGPALIPSNLHQITTILSQIHPTGITTPLLSHINYLISSHINQLAPTFKREGKRLSLIIATDGLPTNDRGKATKSTGEAFLDGLKQLMMGYPITVIIRLCTNDEEVNKFYRNASRGLKNEGLEMEVLDDYMSEVMAVERFNKWLNYALVLHQCREMGLKEKVFGFLDKRPLSRAEVRDMCRLLFFGTTTDDEEDDDDAFYIEYERQRQGCQRQRRWLPDPDVDWAGFVREITFLLKSEQKQWNPIKRKFMPWINMKELNRCYGNEQQPGIMSKMLRKIVCCI